jgi:cytochrome c2
MVFLKPIRTPADYPSKPGMSRDRASGLVWNPPTLDRYLTAPREVVPSTLMSYPGLKDEHARSDLIAFLASLR